ncbi:hypothetical protein [Primorskyibacter sp. 2E233]|uniref:hypothetical protein n=1 Tax=Primorskyibacter sp. 2E233 TaxID=3413431 RepID=UPI003BF1ECD6
MGLTWTDSQDASFQDAYLDWSWLLTRRRAALNPAQPDKGTFYEPIFVRLTGPAARDGLIEALNDGSGVLLMDGYEYTELVERAGKTDPLKGLPDEYALYRRLGTSDADFADLFHVLDSGVPVSIADVGSGPVQARSAPPSGKPGAPIIAVVDDGIAFLNGRFRRQAKDGTQTSRFHAVWVQALEQYSGGGQVVLGETLNKDEITALLGQDETDVYANLNNRLFGVEARQVTNFSASHGTNVLDLAAGADPNGTDEARDWPLLAVQLPPQAIEDTSGTLFESYMIQAVRWVLRSARQVDPTAPVIVNLSLGVLAGPKDGTRFVEYQIAREASEWERVTGQPVRVVWSFGNNFETRLVAQLPYKASATRKRPVRKTTWRVQPGDQTPSYMEVRVPHANLGDLQIALTAPDGTASGFQDIAPGQWRTLENDGAAVARIYHVAPRDYGNGVISPAHFVLALALTDGRKTGEPETPSGAWQVKLQHSGPEALNVVAQIQRDDGLRGYRSQARQSYFDDEFSHEWDDETMSYSAYGKGCAITHAGSHSAMVTAPVRQVFSAGAALRRPAPEHFTVARYCPEGADWSVPGPTASTIADDSVFHRGVLSSGTFSGSTRALSGTSASAARLTRALGLSAKRIISNGGQGPRTADLDPAKCDLFAVATADQPRLGEYVVGLNSGPGRIWDDAEAAPPVS